MTIEPPSSIAIDGGTVQLDSDGSPLRVIAAADPDIWYLLDASRQPWHTAEHRWGSGFLVTDAGSGRWNVPTRTSRQGNKWVSGHGTVGGLEISVRREVGARLIETFEFNNRSDAAISIDTLGIVVPIGDTYLSAEDSLRSAVHAHIWPGGAHGFLLAQPMHGNGPVLSLRAERGSLGAYSIESRNAFTGSNVRGHIVLHVTDGRAPHAFGGQERLQIAAGDSYVLRWSVGLHPDRARAVSAVLPDWAADHFALASGQPFVIRGTTVDQVQAPGATVTAGPDRTVEVRCPEHRLIDVRVGADRTAVMFTGELTTLVARRVRYILDHHRARQRGGDDAAAFVPLDTRTGLTRLTSGWPDWSDGAERIAMPLLLQEARLHGMVGSEVDAPLRAWAKFARTRLLDEQGSPRWGSDTTQTEPRLYNSPWLAHFFADEHVLTGDVTSLDVAGRILERSIELGGEQHLSIGMPEATLHVAGLLHRRGERDRAERLFESLIASARHFAALGRKLPAHEVNYEQSMVAPLVSLLAAGYTLTRSDDLLVALTEALSWMEAFAGPQPHALMRNVGIRHWDGYWFGALRLWGDTMPHHWSVLNSVALGQLPTQLRSPERAAAEQDGFLANLFLIGADGSGTSAFVMPSAIDGRPAHLRDPLANDQDWALTLYLRRLRSSGGWPAAASDLLLGTPAPIGSSQ